MIGPASFAVWIILALGSFAAQIPDLTGTWKLNVAKSSWGKKQKPSSVLVVVEHNEPALKYHGTVVDAHGDGRHFDFSGAIDGREHPVSGQYGEGKTTIRRVDSNTTTSRFQSNDGLIVETARTILSRDGKVLTRQLRLKDPNGEISWTEIYEKH
jgi:hypothetical protein